MIEKTLEKELNLAGWQVRKVIKLIDDGNTIPFIARYRKDVTGSLNDETLRKFDERLKYLRNLEDKKEKIIKRIDELGKLDDDLKNRILKAETLVELEDLYRPYKSKKQTRADPQIPESFFLQKAQQNQRHAGNPDGYHVGPEQKHRRKRYSKEKNIPLLISSRPKEPEKNQQCCRNPGEREFFREVTAFIDAPSAGNKCDQQSQPYTAPSFRSQRAELLQNKKRNSHIDDFRKPQAVRAAPAQGQPDVLNQI